MRPRAGASPIPPCAGCCTCACCWKSGFTFIAPIGDCTERIGGDPIGARACCCCANGFVTPDANGSTTAPVLLDTGG
jgi:hypothetical protein